MCESKQMFSRCSPDFLQFFSRCSSVVLQSFSKCSPDVLDLAVSDHYSVFFNITSSIQLETIVRTVRKHHLTPEVTAGGSLLADTSSLPPVILSSVI